MKKILYLVTQSEFGGAQRHVFDLATHSNKKFDIVVAAGENPNGELFTRLARFDLTEIKTTYLKYLKRSINPWRDILAFFELRRLIKKEKPDIIHLNSTKAGVLGSLVTRYSMLRASCYVIYTVHGWAFNEPLGWLRQKLYFYAEKWTAKYKDKIICVSEYDRQIAIKSGFPQKKLTTIHNGIDATTLKFLDRELARKKLRKVIPISQFLIPNFRLIGTIANLYPTKGIEYLIETAQILYAKYSINDIFFTVIGEGAERPKLEKLIKKYNLENKFLLLGHVPDAYKYLKAFDIFVLPSVKEGLPYTILEAMAAGLPIVATEVGGVPEMIENEKTGCLVKPRNATVLAEKIAYLLNTPAIAQDLGQEAQKKVQKHFSLEKMIDDTAIVYSP